MGVPKRAAVIFAVALAACDAADTPGDPWERVARASISPPPIEVFGADEEALRALERSADLSAGVLYLDQEKNAVEDPFLRSLVSLARKRGFTLYVKPARGRKEVPETVLRLKAR